MEDVRFLKVENGPEFFWKVSIDKIFS